MRTGKKVPLAILFFLLCMGTNIFSQHANTFGLHSEIAYGFPGSVSNLHRYQAFITPLYHLNENVSLGAGAGMVVRHNNSHPVIVNETKIQTVFPLFASIMYRYAGLRKIEPFASVKTGYGIMSKKYRFADPPPYWHSNALDVENSGGVFFSGGLGLLYPLNNVHSLSLSLSYDIQKTRMKVTGDGLEGPVKNTFTDKSFSIRVGWFF